MFRHLRLKLTVLYAGLFCAALLLIGATTYVVLNNATRSLAHQELAATQASFARETALRGAHLADSAHALGHDAAFVSALLERDGVAIRTALQHIESQAGAETALLITGEGLLIDANDPTARSVPPGLQATLLHNAEPIGFITDGGIAHLTAAAPISDGLGWIVLGDAVDSAALEQLTATSSLPLRADLLTRNADGAWGAPDMAERQAINTFVDGSLLSTSPPQILEGDDERALAAVSELVAIDGGAIVLLLRYQLSDALSPYQALFNSLLAVGAVGLFLLTLGSWLLARSITQPLSSLENAARKLREGVYEPVVVSTKDEISRLAASFNAMSAAIREREQRITHLAYHDAETRLPNRVALERKLGAAGQAERLYLAAVGIDRFADVRAAIGYSHASGLLRQLGVRLSRLSPNAPMARLSSEVLGIAFLAESEEHARKRADAITAHLEQPIDLDGLVVDINITVGIAQPVGKNEKPAEMIQRASIALDQARAAHAKVGFYDEGAYGDPARNLSLMGEMRRALTSGDMRVVHQPKYNFRTGRIDSVETLVRWRHPTRGMISPDLFVPMAEETGHILPLTDWVIRRAVQEQKKLAAAGWPLSVSLNISGRLLGDPDFADIALAAVQGAEHPLCFEITETAVIADPTRALENIARFASHGIRIAIDDYGSGLSSLAYLKRMPAHELKIDKMFVQNIADGAHDALLVRSTIDLAHGLGLEVTAEGVETPAAFALLASMGCDMAQGYLISRPATGEELLTLLNDGQRLRFYQQTAAAGGAGDHTPRIRPKRA